MSAEPYVVRRLGLAQVIPLVVFVGWLALLQVAGFDFPTGIIVVVAAYVVVSTALTLDRLRIDEKGVRMRPAGRIGWEHIDHVTARGFELDPARVDQAARAYSDAGGSFSGMPGQRRVLLRHVRRRPERLIRRPRASSRPRAGGSSGISGSSGVMSVMRAPLPAASPAHPTGAAPRAARPSRPRAARSRAARSCAATSPPCR